MNVPFTDRVQHPRCSCCGSQLVAYYIGPIPGGEDRITECRPCRWCKHDIMATNTNTTLSFVGDVTFTTGT